MNPWLEGFFHILFPKLCPGCGQYLPATSPIVCLQCEAKLPFTNFHLHTENPFTERFWGRVPLKAGVAMLHFGKGGITQHLLHAIKYKGHKQLAQSLGHLYGANLQIQSCLPSIDCIVPVPLHAKKHKTRGFNQSAWWGKGLGESLQLPCLEKSLVRIKDTATQTRMNRLERLNNVEDAFQVGTPEALLGKHVLLVDDVLTTGATLEACGLKILELEGTKLSMATLAIAQE